MKQNDDDGLPAAQRKRIRRLRRGKRIGFVMRKIHGLLTRTKHKFFHWKGEPKPPNLNLDEKEAFLHFKSTPKKGGR